MCRHCAEPEFWKSQRIKESEIERGKHDSESSDSAEDSDDRAHTLSKLARTPAQRRCDRIGLLCG